MSWKNITLFLKLNYSGKKNKWIYWNNINIKQIVGKISNRTMDDGQ